MRPIDNPRQRFERCYVEWLEEPPPARLQVQEEHARSVVAWNDSPDIPFRASVNPYRGCTHACAYCYARPSHEYLGLGAGTDFDTVLVAKVNAAEALRHEITRPSWTFDPLAFSGDTDCYQPIEAEYRLTRACLEVCRDHAQPVDVITKSFLIARDVDLLAEISARAPVTVILSIAFADDALARVVEPGAPRPSKRLEALATLAAAGIRTGILFAPIIPGLNEDHIPAVLERAREAGARFAGRSLLRLPLAVREVFLERIRAGLPDRARRIEARLAEVRGGVLNDSRFHERMRGRGVYWDAIDQLFDVHWRRAGFAELEAEDAARPARPRPGSQIPLFDAGS